MPDADKPEPIRFPVTVTTNGIKVEVVLLLRPGTVVAVAETKTTIEPEPHGVTQ